MDGYVMTRLKVYGKNSGSVRGKELWDLTRSTGLNEWYKLLRRAVEERVDGQTARRSGTGVRKVRQRGNGWWRG